MKAIVLDIKVISVFLLPDLQSHVYVTCTLLRLVVFHKGILYTADPNSQYPFRLVGHSKIAIIIQFARFWIVLNRFCCYPHPPLEFFDSQVMTQQVTAVGPLLAVVIGIEVLLEMADKVFVYFSARDSPSI